MLIKRISWCCEKLIIIVICTYYNNEWFKKLLLRLKPNLIIHFYGSQSSVNSDGEKFAVISFKISYSKTSN